MQLRNKEDGEVYEVEFSTNYNGGLIISADGMPLTSYSYPSIKKMSQKWEDWDDNYKMAPVTPAAENNNTYNIQLVCLNCGKKDYYNIPLGMTVEDYAKSHPCPNCGCCDLYKGWRNFDEHTL